MAKGITLVDLFRKFPDDAAAERWFAETRWGGERVCARCGTVNVGTTQPTMPCRCRDCRKFFSMKTGMVMQSSKLGLQKWAIAIYLLEIAMVVGHGRQPQATMRLLHKTEARNRGGYLGM